MKLLYIDTDVLFAENLKRSLERRGIEVELHEDGREGVDAARAERPDAIVLAVELGDKLTGGYTWCQKLKKDNELRDVPLVLVSSQATPETFEQHKKLKNRAEEYLQKPFDATRLLGALENHVLLPPGIVARVVAAERLAGDDDLARLDEAFDQLTTPEPDATLAPVADEGFEIALADEVVEEAEPLADEPALPASAGPEADEPVAWNGPAGFEVQELQAQLAALEARLAETERELADKAAQAEASRSTFGNRDRDYFQLRNEAARKDKEILRLRDDLNRAEREGLELREAQTGLEQRLVELEAEVAHKDALSRTSLQRAETASAGQRRAEATVAALRVEAVRVPVLQAEVERLTAERAGLSAELEGARADAEALRDRVASLEAELAGERAHSATGAAESARLAAELESCRAEAATSGEQLRGHVADLEGKVTRGEEDLLEAKLELEAAGGAAERARQALAAALAALDEVPGAAPRS